MLHGSLSAAEVTLDLAPEDVPALAAELTAVGGDPAALARWVVDAVHMHGALNRQQFARHEADVRDRRRTALELARDVAWLEGRLESLTYASELRLEPLTRALANMLERTLRGPGALATRPAKGSSSARSTR